MRILFVGNTFPPGYTGGAEVSMYHTCQGLLGRGHDCSILILTNRAPAATDEWYEYDGIPIHRLFFKTYRNPLSDIWDARIHRAVRRELRRLKPDILHIHNVSAATLAPFTAGQAEGIPMLNTLHDLWRLCPNNMLYRQDGSFCDPRTARQGCRSCFRRYDYWGAVPKRRSIIAKLTASVRFLVSPSQALLDRHVEAGYAPERFRMIPYGVAEPSPLAAPASPELRRTIRTVAGHPIVFFGGGGIEIKGAQVVLDAIPQVLEQMPEVRFVITGGGEERFLQGFRRLAPGVEMLGRIPPTDMRHLFAIADLTLVPSVWHENSPVVIYESFQSGTPVIGSNFGGIPELVHPGETGYLISTGDSQALAQAILAHFQRTPLERRRMRQACIQHVRTALALETHLDAIEALYQEMLA